MVDVATLVVKSGERVPEENNVTVPPPAPVTVSVVPENENPEPSVISDGEADEPVGLPRRLSALSFCNFAYVTAALIIFPVVMALLPIVSAPVLLSVASPESPTFVATPDPLPTKISPDARALVSLLLNALQSAEVTSPRLVAEALGMLNVCTPEADEIPKSVPAVPVAKV